MGIENSGLCCVLLCSHVFSDTPNQQACRNCFTQKEMLMKVGEGIVTDSRTNKPVPILQMGLVNGNLWTADPSFRVCLSPLKKKKQKTKLTFFLGG